MSGSANFWSDNFWASGFWATGFLSGRDSSTRAALGSTATLQLGTDSSFWSNDFWADNSWASGFWADRRYTTIAEVLRCGPIGSTAREVKITNLASVGEEYASDLAEGNMVEFDVNFISGNAQHLSLQASHAAADNVYLKMTWPTSPLYTAAFDFALLGFEPGETTPEGQVTASISGRISGPITWT